MHVTIKPPLSLYLYPTPKPIPFPFLGIPLKVA